MPLRSGLRPHYRLLRRRSASSASLIRLGRHSQPGFLSVSLIERSAWRRHSSACARNLTMSWSDIPQNSRRHPRSQRSFFILVHDGPFDYLHVPANPSLVQSQQQPRQPPNVISLRSCWELARPPEQQRGLNDQRHRLFEIAQVGGRKPGDDSHLSTSDAVSNWRARSRISSRSGPRGRPSAAFLLRSAASTKPLLECRTIFETTPL
jgi:hypothetical protein